MDSVLDEDRFPGGMRVEKILPHPILHHSLIIAFFVASGTFFYFAICKSK